MAEREFFPIVSVYLKVIIINDAGRVKSRPTIQKRHTIVHPSRRIRRSVANLQKDKTILFDGSAVQCNGDINSDGL